MNKILPSLYLVCSCLTVFGQADSADYGKNSFVIALSAGGTFPIGKFGKFEIDSTDYTENIAGSASAGLNLKLNADYFLNRNFGITLCFQYSKTKTENPTSSELFYDPYYNSNPYPNGGIQRQYYSYKSDNWIVGEISTGIVARVSSETSDHLDFYFRINSGVIFAKSPKSELYTSGYIWELGQITDYYTTATIQPAIQSYSFCGSAQAEARYSLDAGKKIFILLSVEYLTSCCVFHAEKTTTYNNGSPYESNFSFSKNVNTFGLNAGVSWAF